MGPLLGAAVMLADEGMRELSDYRNIGLGRLLAIFVIAWPIGLNGRLQRNRPAAVEQPFQPALLSA